MKFNEITGSTINPVKENKQTLTISQLEEYVLTELSKIDHKCVPEYDNFSVRCKNNILKDLLYSVKSKIISLNIEPEKLILFNKIFDTIEIQFGVLDDIAESKLSNRDMLVILSAIFIAYFKKYSL